jgi:hypothetical protein
MAELPPSKRPERTQSTDDVEIVIAPRSWGDDKPFVLTEPTPRDLSPYGKEMFAALKAGYEQGLKEPCVLVVWRGGAYAK